jgi:hypothetical protein
MTWPRIAVACLCLLTCVPVLASGQETIPVDLGAPTQSISRPGNAGETYRFMLLSTIPGQAYEVKVEQRIIRPPALKVPDATDAAGIREAECSEAMTLARGLTALTSETDVRAAVTDIEARLEAATCDTSTLAAVGGLVGATVIPVQGTFALKSGSDLIVTVTRGDKTWTLTIAGGDRGTWLTTYGVGIVPNGNDRVVLVQQGESEFVVTPVGKERGHVVVPTVLYHWLPTSRMLSNVAFSLTGGVGFTQDRPAFFLGGGIAYNWNLLLFAGVGYTPHLGRRVEYTPGRVLAESLSEDQLNERQWHPSLMVGGSIRFGGNPFKGGR